MKFSEIGPLIQSHRKALNLTQESLANRAGISRYTLIKLESGSASDIQLKSLLAILAELGLVMEIKERTHTGVPVLGED